MFSFLKNHKPFSKQGVHIEKMSVAIELRLVILIFFISSFILAVGFFSANGIRRVWQTADVVVSQQIPKTESTGHALRAIMSAYLTISAAADDMSAENNHTDHVEQFIASSKEFDDSFASLSKQVTKEELPLLDVVASDYKSFHESSLNAFSILQEVPSPTKKDRVVSAVRDAEHSVSKVINDISAVDNGASKSLDVSVKNLSNTEKNVRENVFIVSLLSLIVAFVTGAMIIRRVILMPLVATENESGMIRRINSQLNKSNERLIRREIELSGSNTQLQEMGQKKNDFISLVAHQLRTPLTGIKWTIDMLLQGGFGSLNYDQRSFLKKVGEGNERMIRFVNDLLSVDRIESGRFQYNFTSVDVRKVLDLVVNEVQVAANLKSVHIIIEPDDANIPHSFVSADEEKLRMVFQNVIENAVRYSNPNSSVFVSVDKDGKDVCVSVKDNGIGIEDGEKDKIFGRFYRSPNAIRKDSNGTGLGLYLAKNIVDGHHGTITFNSSKDAGTVFVVRLPTLNA